MEPCIRWAPKAPQALIRSLYESDAAGFQDEALADEVGAALYARCESILAVTRAHETGWVTCPCCGQDIQRKEEALQCPCGFSMTWRTFHLTYKGKQLYGANATYLFQDFVTDYPRCQDYTAKMLCIDTLIHGFHWKAAKMLREGKAPDLRILAEEEGRPVAANLIEGSLREVIAFLAHLTESASHDAWMQRILGISWIQDNHMMDP